MVTSETLSPQAQKILDDATSCMNSYKEVPISSIVDPRKKGITGLTAEEFTSLIHERISKFVPLTEGMLHGK